MFELTQSRSIPALDLELQEFCHRPTGALHLHLRRPDEHNAFLVAFRTVPADDTGVAHILEHVSLCGSDQFPVRDPFFMMMRRSLSTFMNAMTSSDWTAYPFATQNRKDFDNLLRIYLDAAFFPRLDPLDFAQEGHRLEFEQVDDPNSDLTIRGVVYNEMKGAMSSPHAQVSQTLQSALFPTTTYHWNSGGDPQAIPSLSYEELKSFHQRHYHPGNALFFTYGDIPPETHHASFRDLVLERYNDSSQAGGVEDEKRFLEPIAIEAPYAVEPGEALDNKAHICLGWLLAPITDVEGLLEAQLLEGVLLDHGASPLRQYLETTTLGSAPSELCGFDDSTREATFVCGLEGADPENAERFETEVLALLETLVREGIPKEQALSALHQLEFSQREVGGGRFPYGLQLMFQVLSVRLHGGNAADALDVNPILERMRARLDSPDYLKSLIGRNLLHNPHRVRLTMGPDPELSPTRESDLARCLAERHRTLDEATRAELVSLAQALEVRQTAEDDPELLPKVEVSDVPRERPALRGERSGQHTMPITRFSQPTNGVLYQQVVVALPELAPELEDLLALFCDCLPELGCGHRGYLENQAWQASISGGIDADISLHAQLDDTAKARGWFVLRGKALARNSGELGKLLHETLEHARFDEHQRLRELIAQLSAQQDGMITHRGHGYAMTAASAGMGAYGALDHRWYGLQGIKMLRTLNESLADKDALESFAARLARIRDALLGSSFELLTIGDSETVQDSLANLDALWSARGATEPSGPKGAIYVNGSPHKVQEAWQVNTQVNFCAKAYPAVPPSHVDAPALMVLGMFLTDGYVHGAVRERGGAYGGGVGYAPDCGAMRFYSYRDPRLEETLADFDGASHWLAHNRHEPRQLSEAILRAISEIDRPESPAGEATASFFGELHGRSAEWRQAFRGQVLAVSMDDLLEVGARYLRPESASVAIMSNQANLADVDIERQVL